MMHGVVVVTLLVAGCGFELRPASIGDAPRIDGIADAPGDVTGGENGQPAGPPFLRMVDVTDARVTGAPHANFPVVIAVTELWLRTTTNGGRIANANASDLWFSLDAAGTVVLPHEIERYDPTTGTLFTWVNITSLQPTTTFFVHYGDPTRTTVSSPALVWTPGYAGVWHLGGALNDASAQNATAPSSAAVVAGGQLFEARNFDGDDDFVDLGTAAAIDDVFTGGGTLETWFFAQGWGEGAYGRFLDKGHSLGWSFGLNRTNANVLESVFFVHAATGGAYGHWNSPAASVTLNAWHHVAVVYDKGAATNDAAIYIDGTATAITEIGTPTLPGASDGPYAMLLGNRPGGDRTFDGSLDETRISVGPRSAGWIATTYTNQLNPGAFATIGPEL